MLPVVLGLGRLLSIPVEYLKNRMARAERPGSPDFDEYGNPRRRRRTAPFWLWFAGFYVVVALGVAGGLVFGGAALSGPGPSASHGATVAPSASVEAGASATSGTGPSVLPGASSTPLPTLPGLTVKESPPTLRAGTNATFHVQFIPASTCNLTRIYVPGATPGPPPTPRSPVSSVPFTIGADGWSPPIAWGQTAEAGTYTITATCDGAAGVSASVTFTWT